MRYPTRLLSDDEQVLRQFRPHWRVLLPLLAWAMVLAAGVGVAIAALEAPLWWLAAGLAVLAWLVINGRQFVDWWFTQYVLTTERIIVRSGMVARTGTEIPLENITNVRFSQRVVERLLGYGDVLIESAGRTGQSHFDDIPAPEAFQSEIYRARELRSLHVSGAGGRARDVVAQLEALASLRERGHLDDQEFADEKRRLLHSLPGVDPVEVEAAIADELDSDQ